MPKRKITVHVDIWFHDMEIVSHDEALEAAKTVLYELHHKCRDEVALALEDLGAKNVELGFAAY